MMPRKERVREDRIYKSNFPKVFFNDVRFDRQSKFIYAIAAVDAHGLTSGYSAQTEVGFDRNSNSLTLATISRAGAPKQYPNFFIDPKLDDNFTVDSLTTDAMTSSRKQTITLHLDPDAVSATIDVPAPTLGKIQKQKIRIIRAINRDNAEYVMNIINVDRQISKNFTIEINHDRHDIREL